MADDNFFTFPRPHHITPASISNITALPEHPTDSWEKKRIPNLPYTSSKSPPTNEWLPEAHAVLPLTRPLMKTYPIHLSPEQVPREFAPIRPPPKPPDYRHQKQNMPQQSRGIPQRVFQYTTNNPSDRPHTPHNCQNKALQQTLTAAAKQAPTTPTSPTPRTIQKMMAATHPVPTYGQHYSAMQMTDNSTAICHQTKSALCQDKTSTEPSGSHQTPKPPDYSWGITQQVHSKQDTVLVPPVIPVLHRNSCEGGKFQQTFYPKIEKQLERQCRSISRPTIAVPNSTILWEQMRAYYSSSPKWKFNDKPTRMNGESPLIWTMMHPSSTTWNRTYAWNRPLDEYTPWIACQILASKPVLLSYAMWNSTSECAIM